MQGRRSADFPRRLARRARRTSPPRARKTIVQVTWSLIAGGSEIYALTLASRLDQRFRSVMCAVDRGGVLEPEIRRLGIPFEVMHRRPGIELRLMWRMYRLFRRHRVDVVHTHHFNQLFYSAIAARLAGARVMHTEHDISQLDRPRIRVAMRALSLLCDHVVAVGSEVAGVLRQRVGINAGKIHVIGAGVDVPDKLMSRQEARSQLGLNESDAVVAIVARLSPEKNHQLLLEAFSRVVHRIPNAILLIVGKGECEAEIERSIERLSLGRHVRMLGVRRDVGRILAACDVFVLSSDREGLPIAVLEAMAAARPVVATAVGDVGRPVRDGQTGRLVPAKDSAALADALVQVLADPDRAAAMGRCGRRLVAQQYSLRQMINEHERMYL